MMWWSSPTSVVRSSSGDVTINAYTGDVTKVDLFIGGWLPLILRFDLEEWKQELNVTEADDDYDILDLGYWYVSPQGLIRYEPPDDLYRRTRDGET